VNAVRTDVKERPLDGSAGARKRGVTSLERASDAHGRARQPPLATQDRASAARAADAAERPVPYDDYLGERAHVSSPRDRARSCALVLADLVAVGAAFLISGFASADTQNGLPMLAALPLWGAMNKLIGLYDRDATAIDNRSLHELPRLVESAAVGGVLVFLLAPFAGVAAHRHQALLFIGIAVTLMACLRFASRMAVRRLYGPERAVIVGSGSVARLLADKLRTHPAYGVKVLGYVDVPPADDAVEAGLPMLGDLSCFKRICRELEVNRVVVAFSPLDHEHMLDTIRASNALGLRVSIVPRLFEVLGRSMLVDEVEGMSLLSVRGIAHSWSARASKRAVDILGAAAALVFLAPLILVIALAIKLTSKGPILFAQARIGRDHEPFRMLKFRTMVDGADALKQDLSALNEAQYPMFKIAADPRVTRVGQFLRRTSLDELPQLWNVLRGQMSLVGPRPLVPAEDAQVIGWHRARLHLAPGLTGPWQVMGRTEIPFQEMVKLDCRYLADWSLWNDIKLLMRTIPVVLRGRGL
jgi:exopolysaccharide biosynthesis polyprenyl glycosylphosphotransferase